MYRKKIEKLWKVYAIEIEIHSFFFSNTQEGCISLYYRRKKRGNEPK